MHTNEKCGYFFYNGYMTLLKDNRAYRPITQWSAEDKDEIQTVFQECFDDLEKYSTQAKGNGKMMFAKEHAFWFARPEVLRDLIHGTENVENGNGNNATQDTTSPSIDIQIPKSYGPSKTFSSRNKTILSDEYLRTWKLGFIIRHPALAFASLYRAMLKLQEIGALKPESFHYAVDTNMNLQWTRLLYDWCEEQRDAASSEAERRFREPVLLDANDVIHNPDAVARFCEQTGLDASKLKYEWGNGETTKGWSNVDGNGSAALTEEERKVQDESKSVMLSTLIASSGVVKEKAPETVDIKVEVGKWKKEFGEDGARSIEKGVLAAMPDYEYLMARRCV